MIYLIVALITLISLGYFLSESDSKCSVCGQPYRTGKNKKGHPVYTNKYLSPDFIPNQSLDGCGDGGDQSCYCEICYEEKFGESPEEYLE